MLYRLFDAQHAAMAPARLWMETTRGLLTNPFVPASYTSAGRTVAAAADVMHTLMRSYGKPEWQIDSVTIDDKEKPVLVETVQERSFGNLVHFAVERSKPVPKVLVVAPMSGHFATLLRGTVRALLPEHDVYITDWIDARMVPLAEGRFGVEDYIGYINGFLRYLHPDVHVIAVCQPAPMVLAAAALMSSWNDPARPRTMTLMGGPIDPRAAETEVTRLAERNSIQTFEVNAISHVPPYYPGAMREVYPGFLQLSSFMAMNPDRHTRAHVNYFNHLVEGDGESAQGHRNFYDEFLSVMDVTAEFYLETVEKVFMEYELPKGEMMWRDQKVDVPAITDVAMLTVEGERDDISAPGQTLAAHDICVNLPKSKRGHWLEPGVGHYGIFNGRRWRENIMPRIAEFIREHDPGFGEKRRKFWLFQGNK